MKRKYAARSENVLTALAMAGISLPWIAYEALVPAPADFWSIKGVIFLAVTCLGLIMVGIAWFYSHETSSRGGFLGGGADE